MNPETNSAELQGHSPKALTIKVLGVGGGGGNVIDYMARFELTGVTFTALNTDAQALMHLGAAERMHLGTKLTRGFGAGGDPDRGRAAAEEDLEKIKALCSGMDIVCVVAGLGGGTGTGAAPVVARVARECGALVLGIVTLPFEFEGARRGRQAQSGLQALKAEADGVICLPNQKVLTMIDEKSSIVETWQIINEFLAQGVRGIWGLLTQAGLINVDFNDLCAVLRGRHAESSLATVEASGENRAHEMVEKLLAHPLLENGQALGEADAVLVCLSGGPDLTMSEVNRVMEQINRQCENAHIIMGAGIQPNLAGKLTVTLVASRPASHAAKNRAGENKDWSVASTHCDHELANPSAAQRPASRFVPPAPTPEEAQKFLTTQTGSGRSRKKNADMRQSTLPLEIVNKGRFEKSEPTVHQGQDLDVPTYIRRGIALN